MAQALRLALTLGVALLALGLHLVVGAPLSTLAGLAALVGVAWLAAGLAGAGVGLVMAALEAGLVGGPRHGDPAAALGGTGLALLASYGLLGLTVGIVATLRAQLRMHRHATDMAQYDPLTGLYNRSAFERRIAEWIEGPVSETTRLFAVLFVDLDRFKVVNDTYGHGVGDAVLTRLAAILRENVREGDVVARVGGDEFVVALHGLRDRETAALVAEKLVSLLSSPMDVAGRRIALSASIGIALYPRDGHDVHSLTTSADQAMYEVKGGGKNAYAFSTHAMRHHQSRRLDLEQALQHALQRDELEVVYQPQVGLVHGELVGFEALLRWNSRDLGLVSPSEFIPVAEEAGLIVPIGHWLLRDVCLQIERWRTVGFDSLKVAVNVSTLQFRHGDLVDHLDAAIRDAGIAPECVEIEITESVLIDQLDFAVQTLRRLERLGVSAALDDFGTGYSSLAYLQRLPLRTLKIDRSFVSGLRPMASGQTGSAVPIVEAMTAMGLKLGKTLVAEGVETDAQAAYLRSIGVQQAQGFLYGRPLAAAKVPTLLHRHVGAPGPRGFRADERGVTETAILLND
jgi:diguanylate cyclase (GGDEF)-like protein